ncbi:MAG TPA: D-glycerate dehydrogenase [Alphaproteobacteria bacterium]|nr:D-glycerate dehydrogenase [Alphaproteobacteria bacterium]
MAEKPLILVTRRLPENVLARVVRDYDARLNADDTIYDTDTVLRLAQGCAGLLVCSSEKLGAGPVARLPESVKIIATFSVGYDHIDVAAAKARGIVVTNTPEVLSDATADVALLLMLGAARRAYENERLLRTGAWKAWTPTFMLGADVSGKSLGILGMGRIGQAVARRARGFDMKIHYSNRTRLPLELEAGAIYHRDADEMLPLIDFLSINAPSTPETFHWLDARRIGLMRRGAIVVNTARGNLVDDAALIAALRTGRLRAAGLDVYEGEPKFNPAYATLENAFLMPHIGSATEGTRDAMGFRALDNLDAFFAGMAPKDRVA